MTTRVLVVSLAPFNGETVPAAAILSLTLFADLDWGTLVGITAGVAVTGLVLWLGLRNQSAAAPRTKPAEASGTNPAKPPPPKLISRIVSWTSMVYRGSYKDKTHSLRRRGGSVDVLLTDPAREGSPIKGWVVERSVHVLTIAAAAAFTPGTIVKVRPMNAPDNIPWVEAEVQECEQVETEWRVECRFVKIPPYGVLMLFG